MDPCPFVRITVGNLALKIPVASKPTKSVVHPSSSPYFCKIKLKNFPSQTTVVPYIPPKFKFPEGNFQVQTLDAATFHLSKSDINKLSRKSVFGSDGLHLKITIFSGWQRQGTTCGVNSGSLLGKVHVPLNLTEAASKSLVFHNGWINVGKESKNSTAHFHLNVKSEPDPRFVFQFDGEPECSPQVFQIQGSIRQPVFTCKFTLRSTPDSIRRSRSLPMKQSSSRRWLTSFGSERERPEKGRKGWSIVVHDLSGSAVAAASMVTPFVASPGSDRVSRSNPGSWLILRPGNSTWRPWGRLEAWRERGSPDGLGYRFELIPESPAVAGTVLAESKLSCSKGGTFVIDLGCCNNKNNQSGDSRNGRATPGNATSPLCSPRSCGDFCYELWPHHVYNGFVMSTKVAGEGGGGTRKRRGGGGSKKATTVEVNAQYVNCMEDAAAFVALSAAVDLSIDACRLFSRKLRKEFCPQDLSF